MRSVVWLAGLVALCACNGSVTVKVARHNHGPAPNPAQTTGDVDFQLQVLDGDAGDHPVDRLTLVLSCVGLTQSHGLDVSEGRATAAFGGLSAGPCSVMANATTEDGFPCQGAADFEIVAGAVAEVGLDVTCSRGAASSDAGEVVVEIHLEKSRECPSPGVALASVESQLLMAGESALLQVRATAQLAAPVAAFSLNAENDPGATISLASVSQCEPGTIACRRILCAAAQNAAQVAQAELEIHVTDGKCSGATRIPFECIQESERPVCGDGRVQGNEECDDGNRANDDGCKADCTRSPMDAGACGNGHLDPGEECDGHAGLEDPTRQVCSPDCTLIPICGNGFLERSEACDDGNTENGDDCDARCEVASVCTGVCASSDDDMDAGDCELSCAPAVDACGHDAGNEACDAGR